MDVKAHLGLIHKNFGSFDIVYVGSGVIIAFLLKKQESGYKIVHKTQVDKRRPNNLTLNAGSKIT